MGPDELVSILHRARWESVAGGLTVQPITRVSVHTGVSPVGQMTCTHTLHAQQTPHTNRRFMEDIAAAVIRVQAHMLGGFEKDI